MNPYHNQRDSRRDQLNPRKDLTPLQDGTTGVPAENPPEDPNRDTAGSRPTAGTDRQPQYSGGFTLIPPNESRRSKLTMMAQKEEEALQKWKAENKPGPVQLNPERLGGNENLAEVRERQFADLRCSKLQKKLKKEEMDRRRRQEEEENYQEMKAKQREKAERLEERRRQEEQRRREQLRQDHSRATESFLQRFERSAAGPSASSGATHTSSRSEAVESKQEERRSVRDVQLDHRRVNSDFLDKLEGRGRGSKEGESGWQAERQSPASEDFTQQLSDAPGRQELPIAHLNPDPEQSCSDWTEEADLDPDYDWALMKLINTFPDCCRDFLEGILDQCNGDYEQACALLISTLS